MTIQELQKRKKELGYTYTEIARLSGLPLPTVQKVLGGTTRSPRYETILALEKVLSPGPAADRKAQIPQSRSPEEPGLRQIMAGESAPVYYTAGSGKKHRESDGGSVSPKRHYSDSHPLLPHKRQGEYTAADREMLPADVRTELISGVLYDMASPKAVHQLILMEISYQLRSRIESCGKDCMVFVAPSDVWLTCDDKNIFQPDIYVLCDYSMIGKDGYVKGAPPFVVEILSPATRSKDMLLKAYKYHAAGVHEYWIVDPEKKKVIVYDYDRYPDGTENTVYSFSDTVPVRFSGNTCAVDFKKIADTIARLER